ncbi:MAG: hypothetical protein ACRD1V_17865 [Vicinamibacterales bacterium]
MDPQTVLTLSTQQTTIFQPGGGTQSVIRTRWMYGPKHGPYVTDIPADSFSAQALATAQAKIINELKLLP